MCVTYGRFWLVKSFAHTVQSQCVITPRCKHRTQLIRLRAPASVSLAFVIWRQTQKHTQLVTAVQGDVTVAITQLIASRHRKFKSEQVTERNKKRNSLTDREVRKPLGADGKQIQGMRPLLDGEGFRQRIASLFRGVDVGQLNVLMSVYGLTHTGHIDPVRFRKVTKLRREALLDNGDARLTVFPTLQAYQE